MEKNKFFTHRFLPILSVFLFILFVFFTNVKAADDKRYVNYNNVVYTLPSECTDYYLIVESQGFLFLMYGDSPYWGVYNAGPSYYLYNYSNNTSFGTQNNRLDYHQIRLDIPNTDFSSSDTSFYSIWSIVGSSENPLSDIKIYGSSVDIYDTNGTIFFQKTPVPVLVEIMTQEQAEKKTIQEILGILPLTLVVVVSFLGLRKALSWLLTLLHHC